MVPHTPKIARTIPPDTYPVMHTRKLKSRRCTICTRRFTGDGHTCLREIVYWAWIDAVQECIGISVWCDSVRVHPCIRISKTGRVLGMHASAKTCTGHALMHYCGAVVHVYQVMSQESLALCTCCNSEQRAFRVTYPHSAMESVSTLAWNIMPPPLHLAGTQISHPCPTP